MGCLLDNAKRAMELMMSARIYRPSPNPMQSGLANSKYWILEYAPNSPYELEPLMGYSSSSDMLKQIHLKFDSLEAAKTYADKHNITYMVEVAHDSSEKNVSYTDNFKASRKTPWTH